MFSRYWVLDYVLSAWHTLHNITFYRRKKNPQIQKDLGSKTEPKDK